MHCSLEGKCLEPSEEDASKLSLWPLRMPADVFGGVRGFVELIVDGELEVMEDAVH